MTRTHTFDYCALRYLDHWLRTDRRFYLGMASRERNERRETAVAIAKEYKVVRGLRLSIEEKLNKKRLEPVIDMLDKVSDADLEKRGPVVTVEQVRKKLEKLYGIGLLSFSTKLLWFRFREPVVIFDRNARIALKQRACDFEAGDYAGFCRAWRKQFEANRAAIAAACERLPRIFSYSEFSSDAKSRAEMLRVVREEWFWERVFDQMLWCEGS